MGLTDAAVIIYSPYRIRLYWLLLRQQHRPVNWVFRRSNRHVKGNRDETESISPSN